MDDYYFDDFLSDAELRDQEMEAEAELEKLIEKNKDK